MGSYQQPGPRHRPRPGLIVVVLLALIIGVGGGYLLRYTTSGDASSPAAAAPSSSPTASSTTMPAPTNPPCASVADTGAQIVGQLRAAASAIGNLDPSKLGEVLNQIQRLQAQLEQAVRACRGEITTPAAAPTTAPPPR
ncbi:MAG: hypothetical protein ABI181_02940 [Mycobacteriaceae bacterium]